MSRKYNFSPSVLLGRPEINLRQKSLVQELGWLEISGKSAEKGNFWPHDLLGSLEIVAAVNGKKSNREYFQLVLARFREFHEITVSAINQLRQSEHSRSAEWAIQYGSKIDEQIIGRESEVSVVS